MGVPSPASGDAVEGGGVGAAGVGLDGSAGVGVAAGGLISGAANGVGVASGAVGVGAGVGVCASAVGVGAGVAGTGAGLLTRSALDFSRLSTLYSGTS